ncbi:hypothetical protein [Enterococcus sp. RIT-PI-f]|uniref:hypothetical protein n=1 Tax=Enterococcus sp. RIT-PI-f TaxID=1690244 RepID=UPI000AC2C6C9|nr:hypothetical protein [Enterococcus sp. RIT-PI-f]
MKTIGKTLIKFFRIAITVAICCVIIKLFFDYQESIKDFWNQWWEQGTIRM